MPEDLDFGMTIQGFAPGQKLSKRYSLNRTLGEGGMGVVWLVRDEELKRDIAMKFLPEMVVRDREAIADLKRETNRSLELTHSNIVRIYDFVQEANWAGISMEYVDGDTMSALKIEEPGGCFNVEQIEPWVEQLCNALSYAHEEAHVVHRDLKPSNLMVTKAGKLKITDFGIAGTLTESISRVSVRAASGGTLVYMSPQQAMGEQPSATDDIYSLGATIYDLLTGKPPFYSGDVITQLREKTPSSMAEHRERLGVTGKAPIPPHWEAAILACLRKDPKERPQSTKEVAELLFKPIPPTAPKISLPDLAKTVTSKIASLPTPTLPTLKIPTMPKLDGAPRQKLIAAGAGALLLIGVVAGAIIWLNQPKPVPAKPVAQATPAPAATAAPSAVAAASVAPRPIAAASAAPVSTQPKPTAAPVVASASVAPKPAVAATPKPLAEADYEAMAATKLLELAQQGNAAAQGLAGLWSRIGYNFTLDPKQGIGWAQKASAAGDPVGQFALALYDWYGEQVTQDKITATNLAMKALPQLNDLANQGSQAATYCVAKADKDGIGAAEDQTTALRLFRQLANNGSVPAQYEAGLMNANGLGTAQDSDQAGKFLQEAASQNLPAALLAMAALYQTGDGVTQSQDQSLQLWQQAVDAGSDAARVSLGLIYAHGKYGVKQDLSKAMGLFQDAAEDGNAAGLYSLGWIYVTGTGGGQDLQMGAGYYQKAADLGFSPANASLALMYAAGNGVPADAAKAVQYYTLAITTRLPSAGLGVNPLAGVSTDLASLLASATNAQTSSNSDDDEPPPSPNLDPALFGTWQTVTGSVPDSKMMRMTISRTAKYTITMIESGDQYDAGAVSGFEGNLISTSTANGVRLAEAAYAFNGAILETYSPAGLLKWRRYVRSSESSEGGGGESSGGGIKSKIKRFLHL